MALFLQLTSASLPKTVKVNFADTDVDGLFRSRSDTSIVERMRRLDSIHMYRPSPDECTFLNLPNERLNALRVQDILQLCGGNFGVRFTTEELLTLNKVTKEMSASWQDIVIIFEKLAPSDRKVLLKSLEVDSPNFGTIVEYHDKVDEFLFNLALVLAIVKTKQQYLREMESNHTGKLQEKTLLCEGVRIRITVLNQLIVRREYDRAGSGKEYRDFKAEMVANFAWKMHPVCSKCRNY